MADANAVTVIGSGLAGSEAAWQLARLGINTHLYEMRPASKTPAHKTDWLAEIVCSNSFKSDRPFNASWLLKEELRQCGSLLLEIADHEKVPAGNALAVDRERFSRGVTAAIEAEPHITLHREEMTAIPVEGTVIVASGPLTSPALSKSIQNFCGQEHLYFYDAISPIVEASTIDHTRVFRASRYSTTDADYLNCPMTRKEYELFYEAVTRAKTVELHEFEETKFFEACLPIEEMARRGIETFAVRPYEASRINQPTN